MASATDEKSRVSLVHLSQIYLCNIELEESDTLLYVTKAAVSRDLSGISGEVSSLGLYWEPTHHRVLESCSSKTKGSIVCIRGKKSGFLD